VVDAPVGAAANPLAAREIVRERTIDTHAKFEGR
jgi:hypothetical protein